METSSNRPPLTATEQIGRLRRHLQDSTLAFPNSIECLDMGLIFKSLEFILESNPLFVESLEHAFSAARALCRTIDTNGPSELREQYRSDALGHLGKLLHSIEIRKLKNVQ